MIPLWTDQELVTILSPALESQDQSNPYDRACHGISIDSRTVAAGDLFFALGGPHSDGHDYVKMAIARGAVAAVVSKPVKGLDPKFLMMVPDVQAALEALAHAARARVDIPIIAVTGSVGKTGTKEALKKALGRHKKVHASVLSYNNAIGVPLSLARMPRDAAFGLFEIGMNHAGEITPLSAMVKPHVAIITTVEMVHSAFFKDINAIADAKAEIFQGLQLGGTAILNYDNAQFDRLHKAAKAAGAARIVSFGDSEKADVHVLRKIRHDTGSCVVARIEDQVMTYKIGMIGDHWVMNSLSILAAVAAVGGDLGLAGLGLAELRPLKGRGRRHQIFLTVNREDSVLLIDESYNANPASMTAALKSLAQTATTKAGRRIAVLGDMGELGKQSAAMHAALADPIRQQGIDRVYMVGPHMQKLAEALNDSRTDSQSDFRGGRHFDSREALETALLSDLRPGDVIMVKGANKSGMDKVVTRLCDWEPLVVKQAV